jgi:hypothetical protein
VTVPSEAAPFAFALRAGALAAGFLGAARRRGAGTLPSLPFSLPGVSGVSSAMMDSLFRLIRERNARSAVGFRV